MPMRVRRFLLATGERGLGWETVARLTLPEFEELWYIQQRVIKASTEDGRKDIGQDLLIDEVFENEKSPPPIMVVDPF